ncbi:MAG: DUF3578 domain-containing protein [Elusimicrobiota bacterium]
MSNNNGFYADPEEEDTQYDSKIAEVMAKLENEGVLLRAKNEIMQELNRDKINEWYNYLKGFGPSDRLEILSGRKENHQVYQEIYDLINRYIEIFKNKYDRKDITLYDLDYYTTLAIGGLRASQKEFLNSANFNHVKYNVIKNIVEYEYPDLNQDLSKVMNNYLEAKKEEFAGHSLADYIRNKIPVRLRKIVNDFDREEDTKKVKGSAGIAQWASVPWLSIRDERESKSAQEGVYVVYLFSEDMNRVYLTMMSRVSEFKEEYPTSEARRKLKEKADRIIEIVETPEDFKTDKNIDLASSGLGKDYEFGTIAYKEYDKENLPSNEQLTKDLVKLLDTYNEYLHKKPIQIKGDEPEVEPKEPESNFFDYLEERGFFYNKEIVENFLLSLKVKPFVILTGNTGTGKTKLAQLYGQYLSRRDGEPIEEENGKVVKTNVKVGKSYKHQGWSFPREDIFDAIPELNEMEGMYDIEVDGIPGKGKLQLNTRLFYQENVKEISERLKELSEDDPNQRVDLKIRLEGNAFGNPKSHKKHDKLYEVIPVGSDWTDNKNIVGFYNVITGEYQKTKALDLILNAKSNDNTDPYLLILDEMNLSHVERYFSDFLSAIESDEKIPLHREQDGLNISSELSIPQNLFVIGTVNVDETTYMFSPKVLDRANTIEVLPTPAEEYMNLENEIGEPTGNIDFLENPLSNISLRDRSIEELRKKLADVNIEEGESFWNVFSDEVNKFQNTLKEANFDFAFRVIDEITKFMYVAWVYEGRPQNWDNWRRYLDCQIKQKILPKLHGSQRELGDILRELFKLCYNGDIDGPIRNMDDLDQDQNVKYRTSALKIKEMSRTLYNKRYVSFTK